MSVLACAVTLTVRAPAPATAQEPAPPDTVAAVDTAAVAADSTRLRVLQRLGRLARPPGVDSVEVRALQDSLALLEAQRGSPGGPPAGARRSSEGPAVGGDSTLAALSRLTGYSITEYQADAATVDSRRTLVLAGADGAQAVVRRPEGEVRSDTVVYDPRTERMRTRGGEATLLPSQGDELRSRELIFDTGERRGTALDAVTTYTQGGEWTVRGDLPSVNPDVVYGSHAQFTSCQLEEPHYHFRAGEVKIHGGRWLVARPVVLYFADVPVAWLPFIAQGLGDGRSSGLLTPRFSLNDIVRNSKGYSRRISNVGFYWATNDYMDAALGLDWWDDNYTALTGTFRYAWLKQFLNGGINYRQFWRVEGQQELAFDTQHSWAPDERTSVRMSARFSSDNDFVRQNSFDPREITQSIDSNGGLSRRFSWGTATVGANRRQFLSDDRVETTAPTVNLSLSPMTFFRAPPNRSSWYNNLTWSGGGSFNRSVLDLPEVPDSVEFTESLADRIDTRASANSSFNLGALSFSQNFSFSESVSKDVPLPAPEPVDMTPPGSVLAPIDGTGFRDRFAADETGVTDLANADVSWGMSLNYQQRLIGSTTLTPALDISGQSRSSDAFPDSLSLSGFVAAPIRATAGAQLKTDVYGFWPGFGAFEIVRHKFSPTFTWAYTPPSSPTALQRDIFNVDDLRAKNELRIGLNQTFEAKRQPTEEEAAAAESGFTFPDSLAALPDSVIADTLGIPLDSVRVLRERLPPEREDEPGGPRRLEQSRVIKLLALNTSAVTYDFVRADSLGSFAQGFRTTRITNQLSSDFLRGFSISLEHDLFSDEALPDGAGTDRSFAPHLSQLNLGFSLGSNSGIFRIFRGGDDAAAAEPLPADEVDPFAVRSGTDEQTMIPGRAGEALGPRDLRRRAGQGAGVGGWNANLSYSLTRPRDDALTRNQMVQWTLNFKPTQNWDLSWRSSYDLEASRFNDHIVRLSRDLHRWEANFDFRQTATGNWTFRFEVALIDNRDLKFDYQQRDVERFR